MRLPKLTPIADIWGTTPIAEEAACDAYHAKWNPEEHRDLTPLGWWLNVLIWRVALLFQVWRCDVLGHDLVDDGSYGGPDSGCEALACTRCGWSWHHTMY